MDAATNCGISTVPLEQSVWQCCLKGRGKNTIFVSVQGSPLKACFSLCLHPENYQDPWWLFHEKQENCKKTQTVIAIVPVEEGRWVFQQISEKIGMSDTNGFFLPVLNSVRKDRTHLHAHLLWKMFLILLLPAGSINSFNYLCFQSCFQQLISSSLILYNKSTLHYPWAIWFLWSCVFSCVPHISASVKGKELPALSSYKFL